VYLRRAREPRKLRSELGMERLGRKAHNLETTALLGAVRPERRHDNMATRLERPAHRGHVAPSRQGIAEEVKHGAVVPEVVDPNRQLGVRDVSADPLNKRSTLAKATSGRIQRGSRKVQHRDIRVAAIEKIIDEG
jgi:hypothetical protein